MSPRQFRPTGFDALEDRVVLTAFAIPFTITSIQPASEVNPKFLILTKTTENQISNAITSDFNQFARSAGAAEAAYEKGLAKPGADSAALLTQLDAKFNKALDILTSKLDQVAHKLPFGGQNLEPVLNARIEGSAGVTDTTSHDNRASLQDSLEIAPTAGIPSSEVTAVQTTETFVRNDVNDYINLGVTNEFFKLGKGAILPALSSPVT